MGEAVLKGHAFRDFKKATSTGRHSIWVSLPDKWDQWFVQKVDGTELNHVEALLGSLGL